MPQPQTDEGYHPIPAVTSREGDNIVLLYGDSNDGEWNALAFKTNQINRRTQRVTNLPTLSPGGSLNFGFLGENGHSQDVSSPGKDQLRIGGNRNEMLVEYGVAVNPAGVLVGVENPADEPITGVIDADRLRGYAPDNTNASDFSTFGSVRSSLTRTRRGTPTTALSASKEQGIFRFDRNEDDFNNIYFGFKNVREDDAPLEVLAHGAAYRVTAITDTQVVRDMVRGDGYTRRLATYGGLGNTKPKLPTKWRDGVVTITADAVRSAVSGTGGRRANGGGRA